MTSSSQPPKSFKASDCQLNASNASVPEATTAFESWAKGLDRRTWTDAFLSWCRSRILRTRGTQPCNRATVQPCINAQGECRSRHDIGGRIRVVTFLSGIWIWISWESVPGCLDSADSVSEILAPKPVNDKAPWVRQASPPNPPEGGEGRARVTRQGSTNVRSRY